jgi:hypothetical protein
MEPQMKDPRTISTVPIKEAYHIATEAQMNRERKLQRKMIKRTPQPCAHCETEFVPKREWQRFCSSLCRTEWHKEMLERENKLLQEELSALRKENEELRKQLLP